MVFSPVCVCMYFKKLADSENTDPHTSQENGFLPVCVRMCIFRFELWENDEPLI